MTGPSLASSDLRLLLAEIDRVLQLFVPAYPVIDRELMMFVAFVEATIAQLDAAP